LAREVASRGITVNAVARVFVPTALTNDLPQELKDGMMKLIPLGRWGEHKKWHLRCASWPPKSRIYHRQVLSVDGA